LSNGWQKKTSVSLLQTKLTIPFANKNNILRPRLLQYLSSIKNNILITASAGYGKSTLVSQWLNTTGSPAGWFSLEKRDNTPQIFLSYLVGAIKNAYEAVGVVFEITQEDYAEPLILLESILNNIIHHIDTSLVVVIDDYHLIETDNDGIHAMVQFLLEHPIPQLKLVILSRVTLPWSVARLKMNQTLVELTFEDLRFNPQECAIYFNLPSLYHLTPKQRILLAEFTDGWPIGLQLVMLRLANDVSFKDIVRDDGATDQLIADYLLSEIFEQQSPDIQTFLIESSLLNRLNSQLCDTALNRSDSQKMLQTIEKLGLMIIPLDNHQKWYRYHHLLRDFLRTQATAKQNFEEIHRCASRWFAQYVDGGLEPMQESLYHAQKLSWEELQTRLDDFAIPLLKTGHSQLLIQYFETIPLYQLKNYPHQFVHYVWAVFANGDIKTVRQLLDEHLPNLSDNLRGDIAAIRASITIDWEKQRELCKKALYLLSQQDTTTRAMVQMTLARIYFFVDGKTDDAIQRIQEAVELSQQAGAGQIWNISIDCLLTFMQRQGNLAAAEALCWQAIDYCTKNRRSALSCEIYSHLGKILSRWS